MSRTNIDLNERNRAMTRDLESGIDPEEVASKYRLTLPYIRSILRREGNDHLLDGAKPRLRSRRQNV